MAVYRYCYSTRRIAEIDFLPEGAFKPVLLCIYEARFTHNGSYFEEQYERVAVMHLDSPESAFRCLRHFGVLWDSANSLEEAKDEIADDYSALMSFIGEIL